ncbi:free fatty acid receptor 4-like [Gigantopelta aegis]|uniref:free fatty acid receptor 4-like n=1 Tax=Gigantopelta aegis TaxID=1735272 RepID=UPI001B88CAFB|nr:free fatty acid receptor 4-like [Gigantopelta aegis]
MWDQTNQNFNSSYLFVNDDKRGWGNTTFFSYFSQFNRSSSAYGITEAAILTFLFILSLYFNIVVCAQLICNRRMCTVTNSFICSLTIADMFLTFGAPMIAVTRITGSWIFGSWACSMMVYTEFVCGFVGIWTMTLIGLDRYICIVGRPVTRLTQRSALCILLVVWVSALLCFLPMILYFDVHVVTFGQSHVTICTLIWPRQPKTKVSLIFIIILLLCVFIIPFGLLTWSYVNIFRRFWMVRQSIIKSRGKDNNPLRISSMSHKKRRDKRDFRIAKKLFCLLVFFFVMWAPIFVVVVFIGADQHMRISSHVFVSSIAVCMGNAVVNPLYYGVVVERLRPRLSSCSKCYKFQSVQSTPDAEQQVAEHEHIRVISDGIVSENKE